MKGFMKACILTGFVLMLCLGGAVGQYGSKVNNVSPDDGRIVEDFTAPQLPVSIQYWDIGSTPTMFDEGDVLYLHVGPLSPGGPIMTNDIRLTPFDAHPAGSKVTGADNDIGKPLSLIPGVSIVFVDEGGVIGQYDIGDSVYINAVPPAGRINTGDIRLNATNNGPAGSRVLDTDPDNGAACITLHNGLPVVTGFAAWSPLSLGCVRFYNANGNVQNAVGSPPTYDAPDQVYFDISVPSLGGIRTFGYITPNAIRLNN
ncbi:MAG: hypothetical protein ACXQT4_04540 [Methanotrichaceae archaeon]